MWLYYLYFWAPSAPNTPEPAPAPLPPIPKKIRQILYGSCSPPPAPKNGIFYVGFLIRHF